MDRITDHPQRLAFFLFKYLTCKAMIISNIVRGIKVHKDFYKKCTKYNGVMPNFIVVILKLSHL